MTAIFISHSSADSATALELKHWLEAQGHNSLFLDFDPEEGIKGGSDWEQTLYQKLRQCQAVIALLTPNWLDSKWCFAELVQAREHGKAIFPIKVQPCEAHGVFGDIQHIDFTINPEEGYHRLRLGLLEQGLDPLDVFDWDPKRPPYPGLLSFQEQDAAIFFGRGKDILHTLETLQSLRRQGREAPRFSLILGASGSGKSSLVRAGVVPRIKKQPAVWLPIPPFRPQVEPFDELAMALAAAFEAYGRPRDWSTIRTELQKAEVHDSVNVLTLQTFARDLAIAARQPEATVLLIIDQAEELFGYTPPEAATRFLRLLRASLEIGERLMAVATLRSDFLGEFQNHPVLQDGNYPQHFRYRVITVDPMPLKSFSEIIQGPARLAGLQLDDGLVEAMVSDTGTHDGLPLLAFTLRRLYERYGGDGRLTMAEYESLGRLEGAIREESQRVINEANPTAEDLDVLHAAFVPNLVRINSEGNYARRRALFARLPQQALPLLRRLIEARLLVSDRDQQGRETIEVAHEALFRTWPQLSSWLTEDRDKLRLLESLQRASEDWNQSNRPNDLLVHRDGRLKEVETLVGNPRFTIPEASVGRDYLNSCSAAQRIREAAEKEEQERRIRDAERIAEEQKKVAAAKTRTARASIIGLVMTIVIAALALWQYVEANQETQRANAGRLAIAAEQEKDNNIVLTLLLANEAVSAMPEATLEAQSALLSALLTQPRLRKVLHDPVGPVYDVAFSPDGRRLASATDEGIVRIWDAVTGQPLGKAMKHDDDNAFSISFSPDGKRLASSGMNKGIRLWDVESHNPLGGPFRPADERVFRISFCPDGKHLASTGDGILWFWDINNDPPSGLSLKGHYGPVWDLAFRSDGKRFASADDNGTILIWDIEDGHPISKSHFSNENAVRSVAFSPDGRHLASGSDNGELHIWNMKSGLPVGEPLKGHVEEVNNVAFSPDSKRLASAGRDNSIRLWDFDTENGVVWPERLKAFTHLFGDDEEERPQVERLKHDEGEVLSVDFSPNGKLLASAGEDKTIRLWDAEFKMPVGDVFTEHKMSIGCLAFSPEGKHFATASVEVFIRDAATGKPLFGPLKTDNQGSCTSIAFSPDGRYLATAGMAPTVQIWDVVNGKAMGDPLKVTSSEYVTVLNTVVFSPDGKRLAVGGTDGIVRLWDTKTWSPVDAPLNGHIGDVDSVAFSPDSKRVATAGEDKTIRLWNARDGQPHGSPLVGHSDTILTVAFSPDGRFLASAGKDETVRLWDGESGTPLGVPLEGHKGEIGNIAFSPDGKYLASAVVRTKFQSNNPVLIWDVEKRALWRAPLKGHQEGVFSIAFSPDGKRLATAGEDKAIRLWNVASGTLFASPLIGHEEGVLSVAFSPDSKHLVSTSNDSSVRLWDLDPISWQRRSCEIANRNLTHVEWQKYMSNLSYRKTCPDLPGPDDSLLVQ